MNEKTFNKWFNAFVLVGMGAAIVLATVFKTLQGGENLWLLYISAFGSMMGIASSVTSANGSIWTFVFGLVNVTIYAVVCFIGAKYGTAILHAAYTAPMNIIGFIQWRKRGASGKAKVKARRLPVKGRFLVGLVFFVSSFVLWYLLHLYSGASTPLFDALSVVCNVIGQFLMSTAYMEQWIFWIGVNIASILMWSLTLAAHPGDSFALVYIIKYAFYLLNGCNGLRIWLRDSRPREGCISE
ncbi:MAG: nicotinamide mononucleotide transporter [Bacteroidales bacterium]|nr:nicotinamide mononucleotide transporter [Bacteroidales bacterium]